MKNKKVLAFYLSLCMMCAHFSFAAASEEDFMITDTIQLAAEETTVSDEAGEIAEEYEIAMTPEEENISDENEAAFDFMMNESLEAETQESEDFLDFAEEAAIISENLENVVTVELGEENMCGVALAAETTDNVVSVYSTLLGKAESSVALLDLLDAKGASVKSAVASTTYVVVSAPDKNVKGDSYFYGWSFDGGTTVPVRNTFTGSMKLTGINGVTAIRPFYDSSSAKYKLMLRVSGDVNVTAVYASAADVLKAPADAKIYATKKSATEKDNKDAVITFTAAYDLPSTYTLKEKGMIYTDNAGWKDEPAVFNAGYGKQVFSSASNEMVLDVKCVNDAAKEKVVYVRGYIVYTMTLENGKTIEITEYSDMNTMSSGSFKELKG